MRSKKVRLLLSLSLVAVSLGALFAYIAKHRSLLTQLAHTSPITIVLVFLLYVMMLGVLSVILDAILRICNQKLEKDENLLLNIYTLLVNFFIPGQGGPILRAIYLNRKYKLKVKTFLVATLSYYSLYAVISVIFIMSGSQAWWQTVVVGIVASLCVVSVVYIYIKRSKVKNTEFNINYSTLMYLALATLSQVILQTVIFFIELHSSNHQIKLRQVVTYTGIANLALFVSLTPGAIGIRESFLLLTQRINHVPSTTVILANVIDRSIYLVFILSLIPLSIIIGSSGKYRHIQKLFSSSIKEK